VGRTVGLPPGVVRREQLTNPIQKGGYRMLWTIFVILLVLWLLGMVTSYTLYGYIHLLLLIAVVVLVIRLIQGRRVV
jgi:membrane protein required for beta-lactamase induction